MTMLMKELKELHLNVKRYNLKEVSILQVALIIYDMDLFNSNKITLPCSSFRRLILCS